MTRGQLGDAVNADGVDKRAFLCRTAAEPDRRVRE